MGPERLLSGTEVRSSEVWRMELLTPARVNRFARARSAVLKRTLRSRAKGDGYFASQTAEATVALRRIEATYGPLTRVLRQTCDEYAREVLGDGRHAAWLRVYSAANREFREGWIPDSYYGRVVVPRIKGQARKTFDRNSLGRFFFPGEVLPNLGSVINGVLMDANGQRLNVAEAVRSWSTGSGRLVVKKDGSMQGRGVQVIDAEALLKRPEILHDDAVIQRFVEQDPSLAEFHDSVATLRLTTVINLAGDTELRAAYLRLGVGSDAFVRSASAVKCAVSLSSGTLSDRGYLPDWSTTDVHPSSGKMFSGFVIPSFSEASQLVHELHSRIPFLGCLGWDVSIGSDGRAWLLEVNAAHNDIKFSEATTGPCFSHLGWEVLWRQDPTP